MKQPNLAFPSSIRLAQTPTPLEPWRRLSQEIGIDTLCKRDDLTGSTLSGNKVRKLEFLLAEAIDKGYGGVITCGGEQSNHARATAIAATQLGLESHLLLRTANPSQPPATEANILLDRLMGANIRWISKEQYAKRDELMAKAAQELFQQSGKQIYLIPEGGSNALGACGSERCAEELYHQLGPHPATVIFAVGSGGTAAGLYAGCRLLHLPYRLIGVCVCDDRATFQRRIAKILEEMSDQFAIDVRTSPEEIEIWEEYVGLGYAISQESELSCIRRLARTEGIITDPVYTGKALFGLLSEIEKGEPLKPPLVFLHTGGIFGLFPKTSQLLPLL